MGLINISQQAYYANNNYGNYQFIHVSDIINNFMVSYVGQDKIISKVDRTDVAFHAQRALQELSYDTLKSCKSIEVEVCGNLKVPLPQDYVNYVKLTSSDSAGIEHILYPTGKTSNPFAVEQTQSNCTDCGDTSDTYQYTGIDLKSQEIDCGTAEVTCTFGTDGLDDVSHVGAMAINVYINDKVSSGAWVAGESFSSASNTGLGYWGVWIGLVDTYCTCLQTNKHDENCGENLGWENFTPLSPTTSIYHEFFLNAGWSNIRAHGATSHLVNRDMAFSGGWHEIPTTFTTSTESSNTWDNYKGSTPSENQDDYQDDTYWPANGERYGLDPQHAQVNGSFFIDCIKGIVHFSSNLSGQTVILKYISDGLGTDEEMILHKFAEEAMYKWIAYAILATRSDTAEHLVQRFKKEKFAETRKAKLRLSNIKLEEITQVLRGKSKHIKH